MSNKRGSAAASSDVTNLSTKGFKVKKGQPKAATQGKFSLMEHFPNHCDKPAPANLSKKACSGKGWTSHSIANDYFIARHGYWTDICALSFVDVEGEQRKRIYFFPEEPQRIAVELYIQPYTP